MTRFGLALALTLTPAVAAPQPPHLENGRLERHAVASLEGALRSLRDGQRATAWLGYEVPASAGQGACCFDSTRQIGPCAGCRLESMHAFRFGLAPAGRIDLEPSPRLVVLFRVEAGRVDRVEALSPDCGLDLGGRTLHWLEAVPPLQSLRLLAGMADGAQRGGPLLEPAIAAIGMHAGREADALLIRMARSDPSREVRGEALFWLAQRAGEEAVKTIRAAIEDDPEREVKRQAVFALSELPERTGVPLLIELARTHRDVDVRREAFLRLGEAEDPRALDFFEEVLAGPLGRH